MLTYRQDKFLNSLIFANFPLLKLKVFLELVFLVGAGYHRIKGYEYIKEQEKLKEEIRKAEEAEYAKNPARNPNNHGLGGN